MKIFYDRMLDNRDTGLTNLIIVKGKKVERFTRELYSTQEFASEDYAYHFFYSHSYTEILQESLKFKKEIIVFMFNKREY